MYGKLIEFLRVTIQTQAHVSREHKSWQEITPQKILHLFLSEKEIHLNSNYFHSRNGVCCLLRRMPINAELNKILEVVASLF